ncbi:MAG: hypothetical protein PHY40_01285 [Patescibacteria group bacterium]|nr:hypothetical protein [Patescibacteria group bacterium]
MEKKIKNLATKLRKNGYSYNEISQKLNIPKGTLSYWFKNIKKFEIIKQQNIKKAKIQWAQNITAYNKNRSVVARKRWVSIQKKSEKQIQKITKKDLFFIGNSLYWAEGYKRGNWNVIFSNSDPFINKIMMRFFTEICFIPKEKIKIQIQIHKNISFKNALHYWSKILKLQKKQFLSPSFQLSKSSKLKRKNNLPFGTLRIRINDVILLNKIKGWISGISKNFGA